MLSNNATARKVAKDVSYSCSYTCADASDMSGVRSAACKEGNEVCSKIGAHIILRAILSLEIHPDSVPVQSGGRAAFNTIVAASGVRIAEGVTVEAVETSTA